MYGVKGTSTILNSVARQSGITKQLVAPKSVAFLSNLPTRHVALPYTTKSQPQLNQEQADSSTVVSQFLQQSNSNDWTTVVRSNKKQPAPFDTCILQAAKMDNSKAVIDAFIQRDANASQPLSKQTYEAVIEAYGKLRKINQPLTPMLNAYHDMIDSGVQPTSQTYALLIRSLCNRDTEVQKTVSMLKRQIARTGNSVTNLNDLENENNMEKALALFSKAVKEKSTQDFDIELYNTLLHGLSFKGNTQDGLYIYEHLESARHARPNSHTFASLISLFGYAGDLKAVQECFNEYKTLKHKLPRHNPAFVYNALVFAHVNAGDIEGALDIIDNVLIKDQIQVSILPYNKIVRKACLNDQMETVDSILTRLETDAHLPKPNATTYGIILSAYARLDGTLDKATIVYNNMLKHNVSKQYGHIADYAYACTANNMPDQAFKVVQDMSAHGLELDSNLFQQVISAYVGSGRIEDAVACLKPLVEIYTKTTFIDEKSPVSNVALELTSKCKDVGSAISILQLMNNYAIRPTPVVSEALLKLYEDTKSNADQWQRVSKDLNERSFSVLYDAAFRKSSTPSGFCELAFDLLKDMHDLKIMPSASLYVRVLTRMKKYDVKEYEARWKQEFETVDTAASNDSDVLSGAAVEAAFGGRFDEAQDILVNKIIKEGNVPIPEAVRNIIQHSTKVNRIDAAEMIFKSVEGSLERLEGVRKSRAYQALFNAMLIAYCRQGDLETAKVYYDKLRAQNMYPDGDAYGSLLACTANADKSADALKVYEEAKKHNVRPTVYLYNVIISSMAKCRKVDRAIQIFEEMKQLGVAPNSITYASVISACVRCSSEKRAARYFEEMVASPNYQPRIGAYNSMIQFYVQQKVNREKALEYYALLQKHNLKPSEHTFRLLIEAYANIPAYDMAAAHNVVKKEMKEQGVKPKAGHYATLIRSYGCLHGDVKSAISVYQDMKQSGVKADESVYQAMLHTYIDNQDMSSAESLYKEIDTSSAYMDNLFIQGYGKQGQLEKAKHVFQSMAATKEPSTYEAMVKAYVDNGHKDEALQVIEQMRSRDFPPKVIEGVSQLI